MSDFDRQSATGSAGGAMLRSVSSPDEQGEDDATLARALIAGERWAGPVVWNRYAQLVFRLALRWLSSRDDARDATQEVFFQLLRSVGTLRDPAALRSWVVSVAFRTLKWELRKRRLRSWIGLSDSGVLPEPIVEGGDTDAKLAVRQFLGILRTLRPRQQTIFVLRYIEGFALAEIAQAMGVSMATVKRDIARVARLVSALVADDVDLLALLAREGSA